MRIAFLAVAAAASLAACATEPTPAQVGQAIDQIEEPVLPDYKPETSAGCNAVRLSVDLAADGSIRINGAASSLDGLKAAAANKNAACTNAPAMVGYAVAKGVPAARRDAVRDVLSTSIANIALVEVTTD